MFIPLSFLTVFLGSSGINVSCIYRVSRPFETRDIVATGLGNYRMLWKGTNILNLMSILHKGLQPSEAPSGGNLPHFGKVCLLKIFLHFETVLPVFVIVITV